MCRRAIRQTKSGAKVQKKNDIHKSVCHFSSFLSGFKGHLPVAFITTSLPLRTVLGHSIPSPSLCLFRQILSHHRESKHLHRGVLVIQRRRHQPHKCAKKALFCQLETAFLCFITYFCLKIWSFHQKAVILHRISEEGYKIPIGNSDASECVNS